MSRMLLRAATTSTVMNPTKERGPHTGLSSSYFFPVQDPR
jgi:hypothetical protein